jgi:hypothetical protein
LCDGLAFDVAGGANKLRSGLPAAKIIAFSLFVPRGAKFALGIVARSSRDLWTPRRLLCVFAINLPLGWCAERALLIATFEDAGDELVPSISSIIALITA